MRRPLWLPPAASNLVGPAGLGSSWAAFRADNGPVEAEASLERGRAAYTANRWLEAYESLQRANEALGAGDLELLARAAYMVGDDDGYAGGLERGRRAHLESGDVPRAVRCAFWLGHHWLFRGDPRALVPGSDGPNASSRSAVRTA